MEDDIYGKTYLCRHCHYENLKDDFGRDIQCPKCGSQDVVNAKFWRKFKSMSEQGKGGLQRKSEKLRVGSVIECGKCGV